MTLSLHLLLWLGLLLSPPLAGALSAVREPGVSYREYVARTQSLKPFAELVEQDNPLDMAVEFSSLALTGLPQWSSRKELTEHFHFVRDERFLKSMSQPEFMRRPSWLYPDDGCYARATMAVMRLAQANKVLPKKIFVFGDLVVDSPNAKRGQVLWWYHVAPVIQVEGEVYVIDPAIRPEAPMRLLSWLSSMSPAPERLEVAICEAGAYTPSGRCAQPYVGNNEEALREQTYFLDYEWRRLVELKRSPEKELGQHPPWSAH
jgi:Glutaminase